MKWDWPEMRTPRQGGDTGFFPDVSPILCPGPLRSLMPETLTHMLQIQVLLRAQNPEELPERKWGHRTQRQVAASSLLWS